MRGGGAVGVDLGKDPADREPPRAPGPPAPAHLPVVRRDLDERLLAPLGADLPVVGFVPDAVFQLVRFVGLGAWILLFQVAWPLGFIAMWAWIAINVAYENEARRRRRLRRAQKKALRLQPPAAVVLTAPPVAVPAASPVEAAQVEAAPAEVPRVEVPRITDAERALIATVRRVDTCGRFERVDLVLVHEVADVLGPLLVKVALEGADARVRHDLETVAAEHLPRTVDDFLALPADYAATHRSAAGTTPGEELRNQLHLLLEGCRGLRDAVHDADVVRQQQQSRFLEAKFRRSDLDL